MRKCRSFECCLLGGVFGGAGRLVEHPGLLNGRGGRVVGCACWRESGKIVDLLNGREGRGTCEPEGKKWMGAFECCQCGE